MTEDEARRPAREEAPPASAPGRPADPAAASSESPGEGSAGGGPAGGGPADAGSATGGPADAGSATGRPTNPGGASAGPATDAPADVPPASTGEQSAVNAVPGLPPEPDPAEESDRRPVTELKKPSTVGGLIYQCVLGGAVSGVVVAATGPWRTGVSWLAFSLLAAAAARLVLPDADAGMLRVRGKILDAAILVSMGVALLVLAATIPDQPV